MLRHHSNGPQVSKSHRFLYSLSNYYLKLVFIWDVKLQSTGKHFHYNACECDLPLKWVRLTHFAYELRSLPRTGTWELRYILVYKTIPSFWTSLAENKMANAWNTEVCKNIQECHVYCNSLQIFLLIYPYISLNFVRSGKPTLWKLLLFWVMSQLKTTIRRSRSSYEPLDQLPGAAKQCPCIQTCFCPGKML